MAPASKSAKKEKKEKKIPTPIHTLPDDEPKPQSKSPKPVNEIDEIFQATKSKKRKEKPSQESEQSESVKKAKGDGESNNGKKKKGKKTGSRRVLDEGPEAKAKRRTTNDGLAIYSAEELGFGNPNAGGSALCPFDCDCCF